MEGGTGIWLMRSTSKSWKWKGWDLGDHWHVLLDWTVVVGSGSVVLLARVRFFPTTLASIAIYDKGSILVKVSLYLVRGGCIPFGSLFVLLIVIAGALSAATTTAAGLILRMLLRS